MWDVFFFLELVLQNSLQKPHAVFATTSSLLTLGPQPIPCETQNILCVYECESRLSPDMWNNSNQQNSENREIGLHNITNTRKCNITGEC